MYDEQNGVRNDDRSGEDVTKGKCVGREKWNGNLGRNLSEGGLHIIGCRTLCVSVC